jgi:hypothetical protein
VCLAIGTFLWNHRRLPEETTHAPTRSGLRVRIRRFAERLTAANPETQAGFFFTWQTMTRSAPHRTTGAIALAAGLTHLLIVLAASGVHRFALPTIPLGVLGIDILALTSLIAGFRYAVTVPPELASNWTIRMAWLGDERGYVAGVKRAALVALATMPLLVLLPLHVVLLGPAIAAAHTIYGFLFAIAMLDGLFLGYRQFPFACSYVPIENPKLLWPTGLATVLLVVYGFAGIERWALQTTTGTAAFGIALGAIALLISSLDRAKRRERLFLDFDERPATSIQRLGVFERIAIGD